MHGFKLSRHSIEAVRACGLKSKAVVNVRRVFLRRQHDAEAERINSEAISVLVRRRRKPPACIIGDAKFTRPLTRLML